MKICPNTTDQNEGAKMTKKIYLSLILPIVFSLNACAKSPHFSDVTLYFESDPYINDNVLLPVDVVIVDRSLAETILEIGPDNWFGDTLRDRLVGDEVHHLAIKGSSQRQVEVTIPEETTKVIIYADYENNLDRPGQQIVISPEKTKFQRRYNVKIQNNKMELAP